VTSPSLPNQLAINLLEQAEKTEARLEAGLRTGVAQTEETITQSVLLELALSQPNLSVQTYTRKEENQRSGADWIWWWHGSTDWFGGLVQAKRLKQRNQREGYELNYRPRRSRRRQVDVLLSASARLQVPATYALYNHKTVTTRSGACPYNLHGTSAEGITALDANVADQLINSSRYFNGQRHVTPALVPLTDVAAHARPWSCLASCAAAGCTGWSRPTADLMLRAGVAVPPDPAEDLAWMGMSFALVAASSLLVPQLGSADEEAMVDYVTQGLRERPPQYVLEPQRLTEEDWLDEEDPDLSPGDVGRVVVVERRPIRLSPLQG
jgi:hypothetical protein